MKIISKNKKAFFEYQISDKLEAGLVLKSDEVKSARASRANINGSYIKPLKLGSGVELWLLGSNFADTSEPDRTKKLLLKKSEIEKIVGKLTSKNLTVLPLEAYFNHGVVKVSIGIAARKNKADKREDIKKKDILRDIQRDLKS